MSDDLTVMGIAATAAAAMGREQIVLAHQAEHPLAGNPDVATDPKPSPDLAVALALPGRCLQVGFDRHQQRLVRDRGLRSPTLCRRLLGVLAGGHGVERGAGHAPGGADPPQAVGQTRAGRGGRHSSPRPPPPQRAEGLRLGLQQFHLHGQLSDPLHGAIQFRLHRIALALLERGVDPADRFLTPLLEPEDLYAQLARQKLHRLVTQKPQNDLTLARHRPSLAKSQRACRQSLAWGKRGRAKLARNLPQGPSTATFFSKLSVMFRSSLDTSIKPILCPRKSGPTHEQFLEAGHYERTPLRRGYANGVKPKRLDTPAGTVTVNVPKTAGHDEPFYPQSLERGRRSSRAVMLAVAEMYVKGVSTRDAEAVMKEFGIESLSSTQVSRAAKLLDDELEAWRTRPLGEIRYLIVDARYEKVREGGVVRDAAVLSAIGIGPDERRRVLGVSCALSEAEVHWRAFLEKSDQPRYARCPIRGLRRPRGPARGAQGGAHRRHLATLPVPSGTKRHSPCAHAGDPQAHRRGAAASLERPGSELGNRKPSPPGRKLSR